MDSSGRLQLGQCESGRYLEPRGWYHLGMEESVSPFTIHIQTLINELFL